MYYDLLAKIKNGQRAKKESVQTAFSQFDFGVANILKDAGYISEVQKRNVGKKSILEVKLRYRKDEPALTDFRIISKPSRRLYIGYRDLKPVKQHYGMSVLSTPSGIMTNREARKKKVGGECLFEVW